MKLILLLNSLFLVSSLSGQYLQNYCSKWYFGNNAGINFNTTSPTVLIDGQMVATEGCMTLSKGDYTFFYTNGIQVWNNAHQIMPNGSGLLGNQSSTQSGLSVPVPDHSNLFYLFTTDANENNLANGLRYSIIDMDLNGGLGDVTSTKNVLLHYKSTEKITVIPHANNIDYWVIAHDWGTNNFLAYLVSSSGLDTTPVISSVGLSHGYPSDTYCGNAVGYMKASPNGSKIALTLHNSMIVQLFDFDRYTGIVSNPLTSNTFPKDTYGIEFSPDGTKLYVSTIYANSKIYQFDLNTTNFFANPTVIASSSSVEYSSLMLAPDGKIYVALYSNNSYLGVINNPNSTGTACSFVQNGFYLSTGKSTRGLPNMFYYNPVTSISDLDLMNSDKLSIFPNPTTNKNIIYISGVKPENATISIFDISGKSVISKEIENTSESFYLDINDLKSGLYLVKVDQNGKLKTGEFTVK